MICIVTAAAVLYDRDAVHVILIQKFIMFVLSGFVLDKEDNSVTRSDAYFRELFNKCGLYIHSIKVCISQNDKFS